MELLFYHEVCPFGSVQDNELEYSVVAARYRGKWVCVRLKGRRDWCFPGGGREGGESMEENARRELFEETGAVDFRIWPLGLYGVDHRDVPADEADSLGSPGQGILLRENRPGKRVRISWGGLYGAEISSFDSIPEEFEIAERCYFEKFPLDNARFPLIMPGMMEWLNEHMIL